MKSFESLSAEVKKYNSRLLKENKLNDIFNSNYKGVQILFSPLIKKPKVLLLGINPGSGFFDNEGKKVQRFNPLGKHEYFKYTYPLAQQMKSVFESIDQMDVLRESVKSNFFYFATTDEKDLNSLKKSLDEKSEEEFIERAYQWTYDLIKIVNPKIVICEGFNTFNHLLEDIDYKVTNKKSGLTWKYCELNGIKVIACKRFRSIIVGKHLFARKLNELLK